MTDVEVVRRVAMQFGADGHTPVAVERISLGHINETFVVRAPERAIVVQRINRSVFTDVDGMLANAVTVHRHVGALVPEPLPDRTGDYAVHDGPDVWRASAYVDAQPVSAPTTADVGAAAELLGRFHARLADLDPNRIVETLPRFHDPARRLDALRSVVAADPCGRAETVRDEIAAAFAHAPLAELANDLRSGVPRRVAHNDAKLDNVMFRGGDAVCIVDLDTLMPGAWFWDVGDLLRSAATRAAEDEPDAERVVVDRSRYDAIIDGYRRGVSCASLTEAELRALDAAGAIVTFEQAVRFLTDWVAGDVYYRTTRPAQNRDRARAQFRLLASMPT